MLVSVIICDPHCNGAHWAGEPILKSLLNFSRFSETFKVQKFGATISDTIMMGFTDNYKKQVKLFYKQTNDIIKQKYVSGTMNPVY